MLEIAWVDVAAALIVANLMVDTADHNALGTDVIVIAAVAVGQLAFAVGERCLVSDAGEFVEVVVFAGMVVASLTADRKAMSMKIDAFFLGLMTAMAEAVNFAAC
ncbi:hypothetical protein ACLOJK_031310 [Asimina triloba]